MIPILRKHYRSLHGRYAVVGQLNPQGEHPIYAVALLGLQALQFVWYGGTFSEKSKKGRRPEDPVL
jgi:hypothetical protein